jgi:hypothetical protein
MNSSKIITNLLIPDNLYNIKPSIKIISELKEIEYVYNYQYKAKNNCIDYPSFLNNYENLNKRLCNLIFKEDIGYLTYNLLTLHEDIDGNKMKIVASYNLIDHHSYFDIINIDILVGIITKLNNPNDVIALKECVNNIPDTKEFNDLWSYIGNNAYNPGISKITDHPLIKNFYNEYVKITNNNFLNIKEGNIYITIYNTKNEQTLVAICKQTFNIHRKVGQISIGNLNDVPYH